MMHPNQSYDLAKQLLKMAGMEGIQARKLVLVIEVDEIPTLYVETYFKSIENVPELISTKLEVSDKPVMVKMDGGLKVEIANSPKSPLEYPGIYESVQWMKKTYPHRYHVAAVACPTCKGVLTLTIYENGHVHGECKTKGCHQWTE